ncbi:protease inhibitor, putative, partial [Rhizoctonia solani AG-3 Rhs1AP]
MKSYTILFVDEATKGQMDNYKQNIQKSGGSIKHEYDSLKGVTAILPEDRVQPLANDPIVSIMEADTVATTQG